MDKKEALLAAMKQIEKEFGKGSIMRLVMIKFAKTLSLCRREFCRLTLRWELADFHAAG